MASPTPKKATSVEATVTSKGQVTLPKELRKHLGVQTGSRIRFSIPLKGSVKVEPGYPTGDIPDGGQEDVKKLIWLIY